MMSPRAAASSARSQALSLVITHPFGLGALEFARAYYDQDAHEVYLSMFLNAGWLGGTLYIAVVLLTIGLGFRQVVRDRGGDGVSAVLAAAFIGMAVEGAIVDTDHWRHFYLIMAMIWGLALASNNPRDPEPREAMARMSATEQPSDGGPPCRSAECGWYTSCCASRCAPARRCRNSSSPSIRRAISASPISACTDFWSGPPPSCRRLSASE